MPLNIPNALTLLRILLVPVLVLIFYLPFQGHLLVAAGVFALAAATDWVDGYLARRLEQSTPFGAFLDPVADKLMVVVALVLLVERHNDLLFTLAACVIISREIVVSALLLAMVFASRSISCAMKSSVRPLGFVPSASMICVNCSRWPWSRATSSAMSERSANTATSRSRSSSRTEAPVPASRVSMR